MLAEPAPVKVAPGVVEATMVADTTPDVEGVAPGLALPELQPEMEVEGVAPGEEDE